MRSFACALTLLVGLSATAHAQVHLRGPRLRFGDSGARSRIARATVGVGACMEGVRGRFDVLASQLGEWVDGTWRTRWSVRVHGAPERASCVERAIEAAMLEGLTDYAGLWWSSEAGLEAPRVSLDGSREIEVLGPQADAWVRFLAQRLPALEQCLPPATDARVRVVVDASATETRVLAMYPRGFEACVEHALATRRPRGWARVRMRRRPEPAGRSGSQREIISP